MNLNDKYTARFWSKVLKSSECWIWKAATNESGYGYYYAGERMVRAHRYAYATEYGPIEPGIELDHSCRNRSCVRPSHLRPVTHQLNCQLGIGSKTHCKYGHRFTSENTFKTTGPKKQRICRACSRNRAEKYRRKKGIAVRQFRV